MPGTGSLPALGSGSSPDTGTILGPSLSIPLSTPNVGPLNDPLAAVPNLGSDLPLGVSPELKDLSRNVRQNLQSAGNAGRPIRRGFVLPAAGERRFVADEVVLDIPTIPAPALDAIAKRHRLTLIGSRGLALTGHTLYRWRIDDGRPVADVIRALAGEQRVSAAQPNFTFTLQEASSPTEGDPAQYAVAKLRLAEAHRLANGDNVLVAVIDSGIDVTHPELAGVVAATYDAVSGDAQPHPHGTAMAGAIAAHGRLIGVAPRVRLLAIRAFGAGADRKAQASAGTWARRRATMNAAPESPTRSMPSPRCSRNRRRNNWHSGTECTPRKRLNPKQREQIPSPRRPRVFPGSAIYRLVQVGNIRLGPAAGRVARCHPKSAAADFGNYSWPSRKHPTWPTPRRVGAEKNPTAKRPPPLTPPHRAGHPTTQVHRGDPASRGGRGTQPPSSWRH